MIEIESPFGAIILISQGEHGVYQSLKSFDFAHTVMLAPFRGRPTNVHQALKPNDSWFDFVSIDHPELFIRIVHALPIKDKEYKVGEVLAHSTGTPLHFHIAANYKKVWYRLLDFTKPIYTLKCKGSFGAVNRKRLESWKTYSNPTKDATGSEVTDTLDSRIREDRPDVIEKGYKPEDWWKLYGEKQLVGGLYSLGRRDVTDKWESNELSTTDWYVKHAKTDSQKNYGQPNIWKAFETI